MQLKVLEVKDIKFSVILPIYNVEKYLPECLDSLINQTYSNLEIICVNDGSPDDSLKILQQYAEKDSRIKIFDRQNSGSGVSRNFGVSQSEGDYISFVDPDDWVELNMYEELANFINEHNSDVVEFNYRIFYESSKEFVQSRHTEVVLRNCKLDLSNRESYSWRDCANLLSRYQSSCWIRVYRRSLLLKKSIEFSDHPTGQDVAFWHGVVLFAEKIDLLKKNFYNYRV